MCHFCEDLSCACLIDKVESLCKVRNYDAKNCAVPCDKYQEEVNEFDNHYSQSVDSENESVQTSELNLCE